MRMSQAKAHSKPPPHGVAVHGGDGDAAKVGQRLKGGAKALRHLPRHALVAIGEEVEVSPGGEELLPLAGDDDGVNFPVLVALAPPRI